MSHIHKVLFGDAEYCGHEFYVSYKKHHQKHENAFMPKQQKIYTLQVTCIHDLHQHQKLRYDSLFQKNHHIKYSHDIFTKVPESPVTFTSLKQHQNHYDALIKLVNNYKKLNAPNGYKRNYNHLLELMKIT